MYRHKDCTDKVFAENHAFFVRVETEDKMLCTNVQKNLKRGVYNSGPLHRTSSHRVSLPGLDFRDLRSVPHHLCSAAKRESGVIYFHKMYIETLKEHFEKEKAAGHEIRGAKTLYRGKETEADSFASELESCGGSCGSSGTAAEW